MYKIIHSCLLLVLFNCSYGQLFQWRGILLDASTQKAAPFVSIYIPGTNIACTSDDFGVFQLAIPKQYLSSKLQIHIKNIAYKEVIMPLDTSVLINHTSIQLVSKEQFICTVTISELKAQTVIRRAVAALDSNYWNIPNKQHFYYIQTHKENGRYVRMLEAFLDLYPAPYSASSQKIQKDYYHITALARSSNFEQNDYIHGEHLNDLLLENYFAYPLGSPLFLKNQSFFLFRFADTCDLQNYYVYFDTKSSSNSVKTRGLIVVEKNTFLIKSIEVEKYKNAKSENTLWKLRSAKLLITTKSLNGKIFVDHLLLNYSHDVQHQVTHNYQWVVEESFELTLLENNVDAIDKSRAANDLSSSLYVKHYASTDFVAEKNKYRMPDYPTELRKDLESKKTLEEQWIENE